MVEDIKGDQLLHLPNLHIASVHGGENALQYDATIYVYHVRKALPQFFILELLQGHLW